MRLFFIPFLFVFSLLTTTAQHLRNDLWKQGIKGPVRSCRTINYQYMVKPDGTRSLERGLLEYGGDGYDVDSYMVYNALGFIIEEHSVPYEEGVRPQRKMYDRNPDNRIIQIRIYAEGSQSNKPEKHKYEYDGSGRLTTIKHYDAFDGYIETVDSFTYDLKGNRIVEWVEDEVFYRSVLNPDEKCIEEMAVLPGGAEYYHNYHEYDAETGRRTRTTFTVDKKIIEVRDNPYSDNILDDGEILASDAHGNWISMRFERDEESGSLVIREITYYP